jgi:hypothetical protein
VFPLEPVILVVSAGQGYLIEPSTRVLKGTVGLQIGLATLLESSELLLGNGLWFERLGANNLVWRTKRISWDGMRSIEITNNNLTGISADSCSWP